MSNVNWRFHRSFKVMIDRVAFFNFMSYLFAKNVMTQSMRLNLIEAWNQSDSILMKTLILIDNRCFTLMQSFLFVHERTQKNDDENRTHHIHEDVEHIFAQLFLKSFVLNNQLQIKTKANLMKLVSRHFFLQQLIFAYLREYDMNVINFEHKLLKWYKRLIYNDSWVLSHFTWVKIDAKKLFFISEIYAVTFIIWMIIWRSDTSRIASFNSSFIFIDDEFTILLLYTISK